VSSSV
jgi:hypothetical protein